MKSYQCITVGILAFHGDVAEHAAILKNLKQESLEVRTLEDLASVERLIIPGGESTVIAAFLERTGVGDAIKKGVRAGTLAVYGTCAGAILLAKNITGKNAPKGLGLLGCTIERNAYGTQTQSFHASLSVKKMRELVSASFIRAPVITDVRRGVHILASYQGHPVLVRQGNILAGTFHPELQNDPSIHRLFLTMDRSVCDPP